MEKGIKNRIELVVEEKLTAKQMKSGTLDVFATPAMIALIEETAWRSIAPCLEEGQGTVGTLLQIEHLAPTPLGMKVWCETELVDVNGRKLRFEAAVYDECGLVGKGVHERFIINNEKFQSKANAKGKVS